MTRKNHADVTDRSPLAGLFFLVALIAAAVTALIVLEPAPPDKKQAVSNAAPGEHRVKRPRVVTLAPHLAELVYAAGAGGHLQAVTRYSDFPSSVRSLPVVGDAFALDYEKLLRLRPDLVLAWDGGTPAPVVRKLRELGFSVEKIRIEKLADIGQAIRHIGKLLGTEEAAAGQADFFDLELERRHKQAGLMPSRRAFIQTSDKPLYTVSGAHWISQAMALCGLRNVFSDLPTVSAPVNPEAVIQRQPEVIVLLSVVSQPEPREAVRRVSPENTLWGDWPQIPAVRHKHVVRMNPDLFSRPGPRLLQGVAALCETVRDF